MCRSILVLFLVLYLGQPAAAEVVNFDNHTVGAPPPGFSSYRTGSGSEAVWVVEKAPDGNAGNVVVQRSTQGPGMRFPLLVHEGAVGADVNMSVRFRTISGREDQAAGLVWRWRDVDNYYVVRANALEDNVVLYKVEGGSRTDLPVKGKGRTYGLKTPVPRDTWNKLAVRAKGNLFTVSLNDVDLFEVQDDTFQGAGKAGLWTKADSVTMFDDFVVSIEK